MPERIPIPLQPDEVTLGSEELQNVAGWSFKDQFVGRLLATDVPQRVKMGECRIWVYRDPDGAVVGFGTLDLCSDYPAISNGLAHPYIPLLAVNPGIKSRGYGTTIVRHLIGEAAILATKPGVSDRLVLDVYADSEKAIEVYLACGFEAVTPPIPDPLQAGHYIVMAKSVSIETA